MKKSTIKVNSVYLEVMGLTNISSKIVGKRLVDAGLFGYRPAKNSNHSKKM